MFGNKSFCIQKLFCIIKHCCTKSCFHSNYLLPMHHACCCLVLHLQVALHTCWHCFHCCTYGQCIAIIGDVVDTADSSAPTGWISLLRHISLFVASILDIDQLIQEPGEIVSYRGLLFAYRNSNA